MKRALVALALTLLTGQILAGAQEEEKLSASVAAQMQRAIADAAAPRLVFASKAEGEVWLAEMSRRLERNMPDEYTRINFLTTVQYEASRAGLDPQLVLGLIQVESGFHKYAVSSVGARGFMQIMPFWTRYIGTPEHNLFHLRTNLRYGCTILRHYLDRENGNLFLALGRYNGSRGRAEYPNMVFGAWKRWMFNPAPAQASNQQANNRS